jgi:hypothetical protein
VDGIKKEKTEKEREKKMIGGKLEEKGGNERPIFTSYTVNPLCQLSINEWVNDKGRNSEERSTLRGDFLKARGARSYPRIYMRAKRKTAKLREREREN